MFPFDDVIMQTIMLSINGGTKWKRDIISVCLCNLKSERRYKIDILQIFWLRYSASDGPWVLEYTVKSLI